MSDYTNVIKFGVLCGLCLQNSLHALLTRYSRSVLNENWSEYEAVMMAELLKFIIASYLTIIDTDTDANTNININTNINSISNKKGLYRILWLIWNGKKVIVLVLGYVISNIFAYVALSRIDASVYTVLGQLKLFTTAAFSMCFLQKVISSARRRALCLLAIGCILVTSPSFNKINDCHDIENENEGDRVC